MAPLADHRNGHQASMSVGSVQRPAGVIVYHSRAQSQGRASGEADSLSRHDGSLDAPRPSITARAPNARPGLTDDTVQGDDAFIPQLKRQPSRLAKYQAGGSRHHRRTKSGRSNASGGAGSIRWPLSSAGDGEHQGEARISDDSGPPTPPPETPSPLSGHQDCTFDDAARGGFDDDMGLGELSPRCLVRKSQIGQALG